MIKNLFHDEFESTENIDVLMLFVAVFGLSKLSIRHMVKVLAKSESLPTSFTNIFGKAHALLEKWNYGVSEVLEFIHHEMKKPKLKSLILRIHHSFKAGVSLEDFARIELSKHRAEQDAEFEKGLEKLRRLVEAYTTLISVTSLLSVSFLLVSTILGGATNSFLEIALISIASTLGSTTLLFLTNKLRRRVFSNHPLKPKVLETVLSTAPLLFAGSVIVLFAAAFLSSLTGGMNISQASFMLVATGTPLFIHAYLGRRWQRKINKTENMIPIFLKSFGDYLTATGSLKNSVHMLSLSDFGPMNTMLNRLESRLKIGVSQTVAVKTLGFETYGRLGERTFSVLAEMLEAGARPSHACNILSEYVASTLMYDKRREQITSTLKTLSIPLHATLAAIFALLTTLLSILSQIASLLGSQLMIIRPIPTETVVTYFYTIIAVTSLITALNIYLAEGDSLFTMTYYFGIILAVSGISYLVMAASSEQLLSSFMGLSQKIQNLSPG